MRDGFISAVLAFVAVLVLAAALRPPGPVQATPTPSVGQFVIKCGGGIAEADCQKLASALGAQAKAANPGKVITVIAIDSYNTFEICFTDGSCESTSSGGVIGPGPILGTPGP